MIKWIGIAVIAMGVIHVVSAIAIYGPQLVDLAGSGFGGLYAAPPDQNAALWSLLFGVLAAAAGQQMYWAAVRFDAVSITPGIVLLVVGIVGAWIVPIAPFWIVAALGVITIVVVIRRRSRVSTDGRPDVEPARS